MSNDKFYKILFEPNEYTCWSTNIYGVNTTTVTAYPIKEENFIVINPLYGNRNDGNVTAFRNILCEFDKGSIQEQIHRLKESGLPYSTLVYSGGKSVHAIVSLEYPVSTKEDYKRLVKRIHAKLPGVDTSTSNPSRFTRAPGAIRDGVEQKLLEVKERVPIRKLMDWLGPEEVRIQEERVDRYKTKILSAWSASFLRWGAEEGEWNTQLFKTACEMVRAGYTESEIQEKVYLINKYLDSKDKSTIKSAVNSARKDND